MGAALFYHLTHSTPEATVQALLGKSLQAGWRVAVRGRSDMFLGRLDEMLWLRPEDGFLPHGRAGGPHDADQPVLLTQQTALPNGAACLMSVEGAEVSPEEVQALERVCILFDGANEAALQQARGQWRALTGAGCEAQYWSEEGGRWEKKAESAAK
ncbi:DNA polymerase III subunit chi [Nioella nitratireducens]|uniref:DNA polymerase III subunit chi n=1 Tax=Nioella nitratireducens TaxID=1287720 RepID=UPI0008FCF63F|nr:DNA polymerase III subunit chi [Nioella nitratireducens]